jgi:hypothetical protein
MTILLQLFLLWTFSDCCNDDPAPLPPGNVRVTVVAILASEQSDKTDDRLECLARELKKSEPKFKGFRIGRITCKAVPIGQADQFALVDDLQALVTVQHGADKDDRVSLKVKVPSLGPIVYTSSCGKFFPIITRYQTKDHERLIIALMVKPCKSPKPSEP